VVIHLEMLHAWLSLAGLAAATLPLLLQDRPARVGGLQPEGVIS
jgi:hypothetical protein